MEVRSGFFFFFFWENVFCIQREKGLEKATRDPFSSVSTERRGQCIYSLSNFVPELWTLSLSLTRVAGITPSNQTQLDT